jgi:hypothetical protein
VFLNGGEGASLEVGDVKEVVSTSEEMTDPATGKSLGAAEGSSKPVPLKDFPEPGIRFCYSDWVFHLPREY